MNKVTQAPTRSSFFPNQKSEEAAVKKAHANRAAAIKRNSSERKNELDKIAKNDTKVHIPTEIMEFAKIKNAAIKAPKMDNSEKIAMLKAQIQNGTYNINYEGLADKLLEQQF